MLGRTAAEAKGGADGRRLRSWVAGTDRIAAVLGGREAIFGKQVALPMDDPSFLFAIPDDGSLPLDGAAPSIIDRLGKPRAMATTADPGARLRDFSLEHPDAGAISALLSELGVDRPPTIKQGAEFRYRARVETPTGSKELP